MADRILYAGVDVGASRTKAIIIDSDKNVLGWNVRKSGTNFTLSSELCLGEALAMAGAAKDEIKSVYSTGYGRRNVTFAAGSRTEIGCHAKGCYHYFPIAMSIIDIGGQDNKIIKVDESGRRTNFKMNRKCAAGTGAFLEEMCLRLDVSLEDMNGLAEQAESIIKLGSYCTVFSATEVLENIRNGKPLADLMKGIFYSVIKRVLEMDSLTDRVLMTGGVVAHNPYLVKMAEEIINVEILVPKLPQLTGAMGAALFALENS